MIRKKFILLVSISLAVLSLKASESPSPIDLNRHQSVEHILLSLKDQRSIEESSVEKDSIVPGPKEFKVKLKHQKNRNLFFSTKVVSTLPRKTSGKLQDEIHKNMLNWSRKSDGSSLGSDEKKEVRTQLIQFLVPVEKYCKIYQCDKCDPPTQHTNKENAHTHYLKEHIDVKGWLVPGRKNYGLSKSFGSARRYNLRFRKRK